MVATSRLRTWLAETHGANFELLRHFLLRFFDSEMAGAGEWGKVAIGILASLVSVGIVVLRMYMERYDLMQNAGLSAAAVLREIRADQLTFIGLAMAVTALLTVLQWQSLFPSLRDCLALAGLPVTARQIFLGKAGALLIVFGAFVLAMNTMPAFLFAFVTSGRAPAAANFAATAGGCVFVFFTLLACQGVLLHVLPARAFARVSLVVQAVVFMATLGGVPLVGRQPLASWWPAGWFLMAGSGSHRNAELAVTIPAIVAIVAYLLSYHRYRRLLLETHGGGPRRERTSGQAWDLPRLIRNPRELAAFSFIWKTLTRSRTHRLILMAYAGLAIGWITKGALDTPRPTLRDQGMYGLLITLAPLGIAMLITLGLRYLFSLPLTLPANWLFQTTGREGRRAWLTAVERFVTWCGIVPVFVASLPAAIAILGPVRAIAATALGLTAALMWFERAFRDWRKLPFTCSYLPGKQPAWMLMLRTGLVAPVLAAAGSLMLYSSGDLTPFVALFTFEVAVWRRLRATRRKLWDEAALQFEDADDTALMSLDLQPAVEFERSAPVPASDLFSGPLVASRGILPQSWSEEIENDQRSPAALLETFVEDLRYGTRLIRRSPLFSALVVLTLTVGIGINASVFTVISGLALRPHVYKDPGSFVRIIPETREQTSARPVSYEEYAAWKRNTHSLRQLAVYSHFNALVGDDDSSGSNAIAVSCNFFLVEGLDRPTLGRLLDEGDCAKPGQMPVVILSETLWRTRFAADPNVIGRMARVNNRPVTVVGIVPDRTSGWTRPPALWLPYTAATYFDPGRNVFQQEEFLWLQLAGRLAPGSTRREAQAEFNILAAQQDAAHPGRRTAVVTTDGSWMQEMYLSLSGRDLMLLGFFFGAFNLVLLISCANVATLLLSRAATRRREIALRLSLGAPRIRLVRMLVTESLLLAGIAGAASLWLVRYVPAPLFHAVASKSPEFPMPPDWRTFAYISAVVLLTGILSGLAPALESVRVDLATTLKGATSIFGGARLRGFLVAAQVAMSMVLLVEAALFAQSEDRNLRGDPGYAPQRVVVSPLRFPENSTRESAAARLKTIEQRVRALPGVHSVAFSDDLPMIWHDTVELRPPARPDASQPVSIYTASPRFLETMGVPLLRGREFDETDLHAVIVSQALARAFWPWQDPVGQTLALPEGAATVVGVARDVEPLRFGGSENPAVYRVRHVQALHNFMAVRFDSAISAPAVRAAIHASYPDMMAIARPLQGWINQITENLWNVVALIVILGLVATVLATTGIYGAVSFAVNQRTRELGIRVALGAQRLDIVREVLVSGGKPVLHGLLAGLWLSVATAAGLRQSVQGSPLRLDTSNPLLYVAAALLLAIAALAAMVAPAHRGSKSDPLDALRCE
jgi:putative ABC transport system permease protein